MDHGKRAVSTFPIATGEYYKYDYSAGVDISRYKNVKVPTSYMAAHSDYDFIGNYDENREAGLLHVADHHVSPVRNSGPGATVFRPHLGQKPHRRRRPLHRADDWRLHGQPAGFLLAETPGGKTFVQYFMPTKA